MATRAVGAGPGTSLTRIASASTTSKRSAWSGAYSAMVAGRRAARTSSISSGDDAAGDLQQRQGQRAQTRADLEDDVVGTDARLAHDAADGVGVDDEVLAALLGGAQVEARRRANAPPPGPADGDRRRWTCREG